MGAHLLQDLCAQGTGVVRTGDLSWTTPPLPQPIKDLAVSQGHKREVSGLWISRQDARGGRGRREAERLKNT